MASSRVSPEQRPRPRTHPGAAVLLQMLRNRSVRLLHMQAWFPHVPLAMMVGLLGLTQLLLTSGSLQHLLALSGAGRPVVSAAGGLHLPAIRGVPQEGIGGLLFLVGVGMLWRSRLAWVVALLLTLATVFLELSPLSTTARPLVVFNVALLALLLLARRSFTRASLATSTLFALTGVLVTIGYGVLGSYVLGADFHPPITNVGEAVYYAVVTMSTVGYGDITPRTAEARWFAVSLIILGLVVFATSLTAIVGPLIDSRMRRLLQPRRKPVKRTSHIIVTGQGSLARNALRALAARGLETTSIQLTAHADEAQSPGDLVIGDASDTQVLQSAGIEQARAVLALSEDDAYNAFVVLAARELNPQVRTVVAVSDAANKGRVQRVHPDVVLALPEIGSELLAMALSGEEIRADVLVSQLLKLA